MMLFVILLLCIVHLNRAFVIPSFSTSIVRSRLIRSTELNLIGGIAEKLGNIVEFISGQGKITEANIEDTLKVSETFSHME
jgi:hypothetical protein